jgi:hypothetical protein
MAVSRKREMWDHVPPSAGKPAFLIVQDKNHQVYIVASGALGIPINVKPNKASSADAISALKDIKAEARSAGNPSVLNVEFAALIEQADALVRIAGNADLFVKPHKRKRPKK